jgi:hypothetical protein
MMYFYIMIFDFAYYAFQSNSKSTNDDTPFKVQKTLVAKAEEQNLEIRAKISQFLQDEYTEDLIKNCNNLDRKIISAKEALDKIGVSVSTEIIDEVVRWQGFVLVGYNNRTRRHQKQQEDLKKQKEEEKEKEEKRKAQEEKDKKRYERSKEINEILEDMERHEIIEQRGEKKTKDYVKEYEIAKIRRSDARKIKSLEDKLQEMFGEVKNLQQKLYQTTSENNRLKLKVNEQAIQIRDLVDNTSQLGTTNLLLELDESVDLSTKGTKEILLNEAKK